MASDSLSARLRYRFDTTMSRGTVALIFWLSVGSLLIILIAGLVYYTFGLNSGEVGFVQALWFSLMRTFDPGAVSGDQGSWPFLLVTFVVSLGGLFILSALIGLLTTGIDSKLTDLRKGRSAVIEHDHTVILGWSPHIIPIISNLLEANASRRHACIVILADRDKVEMEDQIREVFPRTGRTRIVCRNGNPMNPADLSIVTPDRARSIIILSPQSDDPDAHVIKTLLAITNNQERRREPYNIVAEIRHEENLEIARMIGKEEARLVLAGELVARLAVQTSRQSGLSKVYTELLEFEGNEIYFTPAGLLEGLRFEDACLHFEQATLIGLRRADGTIALNTAADERIGRGDSVIVVAQDDDQIEISATAGGPIDASLFASPAVTPKRPERTVIFGWNRRVPLMLRELDEYVSEGSEAVIVSDMPGVQENVLEIAGTLNRLGLRGVCASTTERSTFDKLGDGRIDHVIVVAYSDALETQEADAKTLITLLHLRELAESQGRSFSIVSEMLDMRNRELAEVTQADDFIVDIKLVSLILSQISENRELSTVFDELFDSDGSELYLRPISEYVETGRPVNFYTVTASAMRHGAIPIGYRIKANASDASREYGVVLNPTKGTTVVFAPEDSLIVLAEG